MSEATKAVIAHIHEAMQSMMKAQRELVAIHPLAGQIDLHKDMGKCVMKMQEFIKDAGKLPI